MGAHLLVLYDQDHEATIRHDSVTRKPEQECNSHLLDGIVQFLEQLKQQPLDDEIRWDAIGQQLIHLSTHL